MLRPKKWAYPKEETMREYELTVLIHPDLEIDLEKPLKKVRDIIKDNGGEVTKEEAPDKKRLAYKVKGEDFAVYVFFELNLPPQAPQKIDGVLNITDEVLRHLLVSTDPNRPDESEKEEGKEETGEEPKKEVREAKEEE